MFVLENNQLLPFERNRYYVGKLLTSADFQAEQNYLNQKRCFLNRMLFGEGVVCGLGVYNLDDLSIMVDSGVGIDGLGREIVLDGSVVKKLSAIDGFEALESDQAALVLRYREEAVHPVYAISGQESGGEGYEFNRIREGWQLFLQDAATLPERGGPESEFLASACLYADSDYAIYLSVPAAVSCGGHAKLTVTVERRSETAAPLSLDLALQAPAFAGAGGEREVHIVLEDVSPAPDAPLVREFWLTAQRAPAPDSVLIAGAENTRIRVGQEERPLTDNLLLKVAVEDQTPDALVSQAIGRISLETRELAGAVPFIPLAVLTLQRTKSAYLIEKVTEAGVKRYVHAPAAAELRAEYAAYYAGPEASAASAPAGEAQAPAGEGPRYQEPQYASGVCEIPLAGGARKGQTVYSDEIVHGLGKGTVFVQVGFEYLADDRKLGVSARHTIYGDPQLFADEEPPITYADTAVKVLNDRGSFVVAAHINRDTAQALLTLRWVAVRLPVGEEQSKLQKMAGKSIAAVQPTVVLATRESHFFNVKFKNMEPCTLTYELTEKDSGEITSDGVYTAPAKEGVYEIRISCADMPLISTYAYAVVKKRDAEQEEAARQ